MTTSKVAHMTTQTVLMLMIFVVCVLSALDWWLHAEYATGWAFFFFGCGDACLAVEFMHKSTTIGG